ncbi:MAG: polyprenyl synthetase family protein [Firmicutes bacterium]|nr:polyprenyl synthetase family protein [Bacillota bacterium]
MREFSYNDYKKMVESSLLTFLPEIDQKSITVYEAMKYSLMAGGKRLRPVLLLASCEFAGTECETALPYACGIEYIHTYSLIHDDLPCMDDDDLRRGMPTNHKVYGEAIATLAGDGLLNCAFEAMNRDKLMFFDDFDMMKRRISASYEIANAAGCRGMIAGQVADIEAEDKNCSAELLDYIHNTKTAALITGAVRAGARLGGADEEMLEDLTLYAENLGLAFQVADDILDVTGDEESMGKRPGSDEESKKATYPALYGLERSRERLAELTAQAKDALAKYYDNAEFFTGLAEELSSRCK